METEPKKKQINDSIYSVLRLFPRKGVKITENMDYRRTYNRDITVPIQDMLFETVINNDYVILSASAALALSDIPWNGPIGNDVFDGILVHRVWPGV